MGLHVMVISHKRSCYGCSKLCEVALSTMIHMGTKQSFGKTGWYYRMGLIFNGVVCVLESVDSFESCGMTVPLCTPIWGQSVVKDISEFSGMANLAQSGFRRQKLLSCGLKGLFMWRISTPSPCLVPTNGQGQSSGDLQKVCDDRLVQPVVHGTIGPIICKCVQPWLLNWSKND